MKIVLWKLDLLRQNSYIILEIITWLPWKPGKLKTSERQFTSFCMM